MSTTQGQFCPTHVFVFVRRIATSVSGTPAKLLNVTATRPFAKMLERFNAFSTEGSIDLRYIALVIVSKWLDFLSALRSMGEPV